MTPVVKLQNEKRRRKPAWREEKKEEAHLFNMKQMGYFKALYATRGKGDRTREMLINQHLQP